MYPLSHSEKIKPISQIEKALIFSRVDKEYIKLYDSIHSYKRKFYIKQQYLLKLHTLCVENNIIVPLLVAYDVIECNCIHIEFTDYPHTLEISFENSKVKYSVKVGDVLFDIMDDQCEYLQEVIRKYKDILANISKVKKKIFQSLYSSGSVTSHPEKLDLIKIVNFISKDTIDIEKFKSVYVPYIRTKIRPPTDNNNIQYYTYHELDTVFEYTYEWLETVYASYYILFPTTKEQIVDKVSQVCDSDSTSIVKLYL